MGSTKLSKEQLKLLMDIAAANTQPTELEFDEDTQQDQVQKFILLFKIKEGKTKIKNTLVYDVYSKWASEPMHRVPFYREFAKFFEPEKHGVQTFYNLNYKPHRLIKKLKEMKDKRDEK